MKSARIVQYLASDAIRWQKDKYALQQVRTFKQRTIVSYPYLHKKRVTYFLAKLEVYRIAMLASEYHTISSSFSAQ